jgi:hypothetical protein
MMAILSGLRLPLSGDGGIGLMGLMGWMGKTSADGDSGGYHGRLHRRPAHTCDGRRLPEAGKTSADGDIDGYHEEWFRAEADPPKFES